MAFENLHPIQLSQNEQMMEQYLAIFEEEYPEMLVEKVAVSDVLKEMVRGEFHEI